MNGGNGVRDTFSRCGCDWNANGLVEAEDTAHDHLRHLQQLLNRSHARTKMLFDNKTLKMASKAKMARRRWQGEDGGGDHLNWVVSRDY